MLTRKPEDPPRREGVLRNNTCKKYTLAFSFIGKLIPVPEMFFGCLLLRKVSIRTYVILMPPPLSSI